ncbi:Polyprenol reductase 1 [Smittium culicis]|uniref:Polyprenol reductase 1 n=1 Tax=Smittium culicis TaxID=133412 RepID=A0A1R1XK36_9FUNG|nr:Polyprenol reductase 1 [Smittium culicis]OMJ22419.1 Polyprenol reductase 1 [Smittium culicis]
MMTSTSITIICELIPVLRVNFVHYGKVKNKLNLSKEKKDENEIVDSKKNTEKSISIDNKSRSLKRNPPSSKKIKEIATDKDLKSITLLEKLSKFSVPKNSFAYFYIFGSMVACHFLRELLGWDFRGEMFDSLSSRDPLFLSILKFIECNYSPNREMYKLPSPDPLIKLCEPFVEVIPKRLVFVMGLFAINVLIRLYETTLKQPLSTSRIHVAHFIAGIGFYLFAPFALIIDVIYLQIPMGGWFSLISSPHYTFEILMYLSLLVLSGINSPTLLSLVLWVIVNLTISATETHRWYLQTFDDKYPRGRYAIFPLIW